MGRGPVESKCPRPACHFCGAGAKAHEPERVDEIAKNHALVRSAQVVVYPCENDQHHRLVGTTEVSRGKAYQRNGYQQKTTCLRWCESLRREWAPGFVDEIFLDGLRETLVGDAEDQEVQPDPDEDVGETQEGGKEAWRLVGREDWTGESTEDPEGGFRVDHGYQIAAGEEPDGGEMQGQGRFVGLLECLLI